MANALRALVLDKTIADGRVNLSEQISLQVCINLVARTEKALTAGSGRMRDAPRVKVGCRLPPIMIISTAQRVLMFMETLLKKLFHIDRLVFYHYSLNIYF